MNSKRSSIVLEESKKENTECRTGNVIYDRHIKIL